METQIAQQIETKFQPNSPMVRITFNDGSTMNGSFETFNDFISLKAYNKYRFIPEEYRKQFHKNLRKTDSPNPLYSIIIDCRDVIKIQLI